MKTEYSIMESNPPKWWNKRFEGSHRHEIFYGVRNRQKSIDDGLVVFLRPELHNMSNMGVHFNKRFDLELKRIAEQRWLDFYNKTIDDFIARYGKNYL